MTEFHNNYKSWLLEYVQARGEANPEYHVIFERGPDHHKEFTVKVTLNGKGLGRGVGVSKKKAEQEAACQALQQLGVISKDKDNG